jgi:hypothetical protein
VRIGTEPDAAPLLIREILQSVPVPIPSR